MTRRLPPELFSAFRPPPQTRYGTVTSIGQGICTVQVAGGEIPVVTINGAPLNAGDFVAVQRQGVVSYLLASPGPGLWVSDTNGRLWRVTLSGNMTQYDLPGAPSPQTTLVNLVLGPDKYLWAPSSTGIWRVSSAGAAQFFELSDSAGPANGNPTGICVGPDGYLWIGNTGSNTSDRSGVWRGAATTPFVATAIQGFPKATYAISVAAGPPGTGTVWFASANVSFGQAGIWAGPAGSNWLTGGQQIDLTPYYALPENMVVGPDGNMWVAAAASSTMWRVTPGGSVATVPVSGALTLYPVNSGPGPYVWVADSYPQVWRIAMDGTATAFSLVVGTTQWLAGSLCTGPDGNLWMTLESGESPVQAVGSLVPSTGALSVYPFPNLASPAVVTQIISGP